MLQWGRAHVSAEMSHAPNFLLTYFAASMGPRSRERGNRFGPGQVAMLNSASMGPRSRERGNTLSGSRQGVGNWASMGPRSRERGNFRRELGASFYCALQWGRAHVSAEIRMGILRGTGHDCFNGAALT